MAEISSDELIIHTKIEEEGKSSDDIPQPCQKSLKAIREGKNFRCALCNTVFAQKDFYLNHLRQEHWSSQEVKQYTLKLEDQKFNSQFSVPITESVIKRPRVNIISEQDIVKHEQELLQRIVLTSNIQKPVEKIPPKVLEIKPSQPETTANLAKPERIIIPPPKKRTGLRKRLQASLGKREVPNSDQDTRATNSAQKG